MFEDDDVVIVDEDGNEYSLPSYLLPKNKGMKVGAVVKIMIAETFRPKAFQSEEHGGFVKNPPKMRFD